MIHYQLHQLKYLVLYHIISFPGLSTHTHRGSYRNNDIHYQVHQLVYLVLYHTVSFPGLSTHTQRQIQKQWHTLPAAAFSVARIVSQCFSLPGLSTQTEADTDTMWYITSCTSYEQHQLVQLILYHIVSVFSVCQHPQRLIQKQCWHIAFLWHNWYGQLLWPRNIWHLALRSGGWNKEDGLHLGTTWDAGPGSGCLENSCRLPIPQQGPKAMVMIMVGTFSDFCFNTFIYSFILILSTSLICQQQPQ